MTVSGVANPEFRELVASLCNEEAEFLIVGTIAGASNDRPHATEGLDIFVRPTADNATRVWRALLRFGIPVAATGLTENDLARPGMAYEIGAPPRRVDVITDISGMTFDQAWQSRVVVDWNGRSVGMLGYGALLASKPAARTNGFPAADEPEQRDPTNDT
jgi:hypothetical protein